MNLLCFPLLLAQTTPTPGRLVQPSAGEISDAIVSRQSGSASLRWLLMAIAVLMLIFAGIATYRYFTRPDRVEHPLRLYNRLARRAGLTWSDRFTLWQVARAQKLLSPLILMIDERTLRLHAAAFLNARPESVARGPAERLNTLHHRLFGPPSHPPYAPHDPHAPHAPHSSAFTLPTSLKVRAPQAQHLHDFETQHTSPPQVADT